MRAMGDGGKREAGKHEPGIREMTVGQFLDALASAEPTPGGGSASALAGAMGAALAAMVARLSKGKGGDDLAFERSAQAAERSKTWLANLSTDDAEAFDVVLRALRLPRGTDQEKQARQAAVQQALRGAAEVPLRVMRQAVDVLKLLPDLARTGNPNAVSDAAVGALLAYAAAHGALQNVRINLTSIKDESFAARLRTESDALGDEAARLRDATMAALREHT